MLSIPGIRNCYLISRTHFTPRGKTIADDKVKYKPTRVFARIKNVSISVVLDSSTQVVRTVKKLTGVLLVSNKDYILQTNDKIQLGDDVYLVSSFLPINVLGASCNIRKYTIEAMA